MKPLYYEVHVGTQDNPTVRAVARQNNLKMSSIVGDEPEVILTTRCDSLNGAATLITRIAMELAELGIRIKRGKVEAVIIDRKF